MDNRRFSFVLFVLGSTLIFADSEVSTTLDRLLSGYDKRVRPQLRFDPDVVSATAFIHDVVPDDKLKMVTLAVTLIESWDDQRLSYHASFDEIVIKELYNSIWLPDTMFHGAKEVRNTAGYTVVVESSGRVSVTRRIIVKSKYNYSSGSFPLESYICKLRIRSESYTNEDIQLNWTSQAVQWDPDITIPGVILKNQQFSMETINNMAGRNFSELHISFVIRHQHQALILCLLGPLILILLSFTTFWINHHAIFGRFVTLVVISIMLCTHAVVMFNRSSTGMTTITSLDIWEGVCGLYLLGALIETLVVTHLASSVDGDGGNEDNSSKEGTCAPKRNQTNGVKMRYLDRISRIVFPLSFIFFTVIFWAIRHVE